MPRATVRLCEAGRRAAAGTLLAAVLLPGLAGCSGSGPSVPPPPRFSPDEAARQALAEYDANKDGQVDAKELDRSPALRAALKAMDRNKDNKLDSDEISSRVASYRESGESVTTVNCEVLLDGSPLEGATVTFAPEKFMGSDVKPATGTTDNTGYARLQVEGQQLPGVIFLGLYRIEVSRNTGGKETIPARYNTKTTLGFEVKPPGTSRSGTENDLTLRLTSR